jgi:hypothetical protein
MLIVERDDGQRPSRLVHPDALAQRDEPFDDGVVRQRDDSNRHPEPIVAAPSRSHRSTVLSGAADGAMTVLCDEP